MIVGLFLLIMGVVYLLNNLGVIHLAASFWSIFWPTVLIVVGFYLLVLAMRWRRYSWWFRRGND